MRLAVLAIVVAAACAVPPQVLAQSALSPAKKSQAPGPLTSEFTAYKVLFGKEGKEELEPVSNASPGDVIEYVTAHRNVSQKRLLNVDFAIPIPWSTALWQGSIQPETGRVEARKDSAQKVIGSQVVWRVERIEPGQRVEFKLRVSVNPDPSLKSPQNPNPWAPKRPELRKN